VWWFRKTRFWEVKIEKSSNCVCGGVNPKNLKNCSFLFPHTPPMGGGFVLGVNVFDVFYLGV